MGMCRISQVFGWEGSQNRRIVENKRGKVPVKTSWIWYQIDQDS
jgi:hypothetical protein